MFSDYNAKKICFYKPSANEDEENDYYEDNNYENEKINTVDTGTDAMVETIDESTQLNVKDLLSYDTLKQYNMDNLDKFLQKAYTLVNDALLSRNEESFQSKIYIYIHYTE